MEALHSTPVGTPSTMAIPKHRDMNHLEFDPSDGFIGKQNIFPDPVTSPSYMTLWEFEKQLNFHEWRIWIGSHYKLPVHFCFIYIMGIFLGQIYMKRKPPLRLNRIMIIWNLVLAVFSLVGFLRSAPEVIHILAEGLHHRDHRSAFYRITCSREGYNNASAFWSVVGTFSKVVELGDTVFVVFRKKPLIFLHWFHHATVMLYTWCTFEYLDPCHRWFICINYAIHAAMYLYYALRAMGVKLHRSIPITITGVQLAQMIVGVGLNVYSIVLISQGTPCARRLQNAQISLAMYGSYLVLFAQFFYSAYISPPDKDKKGVGKCHCN